MSITDTHVHFTNSTDVNHDLVTRAMLHGVKRMMAVGGSQSLNQAACIAASAFPANVRLALGLDRDQHQEQALIAEFTELIAKFNPVAIGEIGLDYHYSIESKAAQCDLFANMLQIANSRNQPVIVHSRKADDDTLAVIDSHGSQVLAASGRLGVLHCFTGNRQFAAALLDRGMYISFSGIVTFANADELRKVAAYVPTDRLLIETDTPYLAPVPERGKQNEPSFLIHIAKCIARIRGIAVEELAEITTRNAEKLFGPWQV
jgi:TatD DNase family protein